MPDRRRPWLAASPRLFAACHRAGNSWRRHKRRNRSGVLVLIALWVGAVALLARAPLSALNAGCLWCEAHALALAVAGFAAALALVSRRRAVVRADAARSWLAALPVSRGAAYVEARTLELAPAVMLLAVLAIGAASVLGVAASRGVGGLLGLAQSAALLAAAVGIGALASYGIPPGRDADLPPGSRYVPHRRRPGPPLPRASLAGLGHWPVRRLFASLRPRVVARAFFAVMLAVPLGATADSALLMLGVTVASASLLLLIVSVHAASRSSYRWLQPVPLRPTPWCQALLGRSLLALAALAGVWAELVWLAGLPVRDALQRGFALWSLCALLAIGVGWFATSRRVGP